MSARMLLGLVALVATAATTNLAAAEPRRAVRLNGQANDAYDAKRWDEAARLYDEAQAQAPESPAIAYNLGNALYRQGKMGDAAAHLRRAIESDDPALRQRSLYNLGNALHDQGELQLAAKAYREALRLDPRDRDAKINYEKTLQEMQKSGGQGQKQQQNDAQQNQGQGQQQGQNQKDDKGQEQQASEGQQQPGDQDSRQADQQQSQQSQPQDSGQSESAQAKAGDEPEQMAALDSLPGGMTREEALRILEAMREQEKELQQQRARKLQARARRVDKDW